MEPVPGKPPLAGEVAPGAGGVSPIRSLKSERNLLINVEIALNSAYIIIKRSREIL
jgi:hypothetical protein